MPEYVIKRDGIKVPFDSKKIEAAILKAIQQTETDHNVQVDHSIAKWISSDIKTLLKVYCVQNRHASVTIELIQDLVEQKLKDKNPLVYKEFYNYRKYRTKMRERKSIIMKKIRSMGVSTDRDNANVGNNFSAKLLRISSEGNKWQMLNTMPEEFAMFHESGDGHIHDLDSFNLATNCLHLPTSKLLRNGFNTGYGHINPPKRITTAAELSCIMLQSSQNDCFGGQAHPDFDNDMSEYVEATRKEIREELLNSLSINMDENTAQEIIELPINQRLIETRTEESVHQAMQGVIYNLNTMHSRAGSQVPFSSINIGIPNSKDAALVCKAFLEEYIKGMGNGEQPIFPNIIFRVKKGINFSEGDPYYYLFKLACKSAAKRMNPTFMNIDASFNKKYYDQGYLPATMGCRTYLMKNVNGEPGVEGRGNIAPITINIVRLALEAYTKYRTNKEARIKEFFNLFEDKIELCHKIMMYRYDTLKQLKVKDLPFVAGEKLMRGSEDLGPEDSIEPILKQGTWGIGFIGIAETLVALTGHHHGEDPESRELGYKIIQFLRDTTDKYTEVDKLNWSCYASPAEGTSGRFTPMDREIFGEIKGVTDKEYYTNSFHVPVYYPISIIDKIKIEAPFHAMCDGGHISYVEVDDYPSSELIESIIRYAYENTDISYMGVNFHIRYCKHCGQELHSEETCPKCGSKDIQGVSRVTGYLSLDERFGPGKVAERRDRITHVDNTR